jgi:hypothetical protein
MACVLKSIQVPRLPFVFLLFLLFAQFTVYAQQRGPDLTLRGKITEENRETYVEVPFTVPAGVVRVSVEFSYEKKPQTTIDLGLFDGERFRGWSGGNKNAFTVSETDATPSYLAGPIRPGVWKLILGVPSVGVGAVSEYVAKIYFMRSGETAAASTFEAMPVREGSAWYRGDLHMHDAHSDGSCMSHAGKKVPCPLYKTVETAAERGLDFIAITDHNTVSHYDAERELAPYFDKMLLITGREITTFNGHANVYGTTEFIDFRLSSKYVPTFTDLMNGVEAKHGILSINHPGLPTGSECMGCGWSVKDTDYRRVHVMEAINGDNVDNSHSSIPFWEKRLNEGYRITAIGGSDNHNSTLPVGHESAIGKPTTVVYADRLSEKAILDGVLLGHAFIDVQGSRDRTIVFTASDGEYRAGMGDSLDLKGRTRLHLKLTLEHLEGSHVELVVDGSVSQFANGVVVKLTHEELQQDEMVDVGRHWLRVNVRDAQGKLLMLGNPVFVNFAPR